MIIERGDLQIETLLRHYRERNLTPTVLLEQLWPALEAHGDQSVWIHRVDLPDLRAQAESLTRSLDTALSRGVDITAQYPLFGIPFGLKDNIDVAGMPTTAACPAYRYNAHETAFVVQRLLDAGALCLGKTNMDQFATGLVGTRSPYGVPANAVDRRLLPGGSSSGSAVAVAKGEVSFSLGTDTAGSGRIPAGLNGIAGFKPTRGMFSGRGVVPACRSLDCVSVFAQNIKDAWSVAKVMKAYDAADPFSRPHADTVNYCNRPIACPRIAVPEAAALKFFDCTDYAGRFAQAVGRLQAQYEVVTADFEPFVEAATLLYEGPWVAERALVIDPMLARDAAAVHPAVRNAIAAAAGYAAKDVFVAWHRLFALQRHAFEFFQNVDCLLVPTMGKPFTLTEEKQDPKTVNTNLGYYTNFVNLLDLAAVTVPAGLTESGLPFSLSLIGPPFSEAGLAAWAMQLQGQL